MTATNDQATNEKTSDLEGIVRYLAPLLGTSAPNVCVAEDGTSVTLTSADHTITLPAEAMAHLPALAELGKLAAAASAAVSRHNADTRERRIATARAATMADLEHPRADQVGLVEGAGGWVLPGEDSGVVVTPGPRPDRHDSWRSDRVACVLDVTTADGTALGTISIDWDRDVTSVGAHAHTSLRDSLTGTVRRRELVRTRPWDTIELPTTNVVADHVAAFAHAAPDVVEWVKAMDEAVAAEDVAKDEQAAEASEWMRLSRSKDRIPTAALNKWMKDHSHVDHDSTGYATGGYRVVVKALVGRTRPRHMEPTYRRGHRRKSAGVAEVLYVAKLVHEGVRFRDNASFHSFYSLQVEQLREALPGCVVKVPDDGKAVFVAFDRPEYVEALDAALVEHVLLGSG